MYTSIECIYSIPGAILHHVGKNSPVKKITPNQVSLSLLCRMLWVTCHLKRSCELMAVGLIKVARSCTTLNPESHQKAS